MAYIHIFITSVVSIVALFILTKLIGYKQMSQLSLFDYIIGITIGSIAAEMATSIEKNYFKPLLAMVVYALFDVCISVLDNKSIHARRIIEGKPLVLFQDGQLYKDNLKKAKLDMNEFLMQCRINGYFNLAAIQTAILETNGKISVLPKSSQRPATPSDLNLTPSEEKLLANVIIDGKILFENLKNTGNNEKWLTAQLESQGIKDPANVFFATCDSNNQLSVYIKIEKEKSKDIFE